MAGQSREAQANKCFLLPRCKGWRSCLYEFHNGLFKTTTSPSCGFSNCVKERPKPECSGVRPACRQAGICVCTLLSAKGSGSCTTVLTFKVYIAMCRTLTRLGHSVSERQGLYAHGAAACALAKKVYNTIKRKLCTSSTSVCGRSVCEGASVCHLLRGIWRSDHYKHIRWGKTDQRPTFVRGSPRLKPI